MVVENKSVDDMTMSEMKDIVMKYKKYSDTIMRNFEVGDKLRKIAELLNQIANDLSPKADVPSEKRRGKFEELTEEFYNTMRNGTQITFKLISNTYPDLNQKQVSYLLKLLKGMPKVQAAKDGIYLRLFYEQ